ncbi:MAG: restriction endonuclease subunit S [Solirubrobacterales bacterium]
MKLPSTWRVARISDLGRVVTGATPGAQDRDRFSGSLPFITPTDLDANCRTPDIARFVSDNARSRLSGRIVPPRSVCFTCIGATIGKACLTDRESLTNQQINTIVVDERSFDPAFVYYRLVADRETIKTMAGGAATPIVSKSAFENVTVLMPSLSIQRKIAAILSAYDELIENNKRRIKVLDEMAQRIYREWFVDFRYPGHEEVPSVQSELGLIPGGWEIAAVANLVERIHPGVARKSVSDRIGRTVPIIDQSRDDIAGFHDGEADVTASIEAPVLVFGDHTCKMRVMLEPFSVGPNVVVFRPSAPVPSLLLFRLLRDLVTTQEYKRHWTSLASKLVVVPPFALGQRYAAAVQDCHRLMEVLREASRTLRETRDLLLPRLIAGEIYVTDLEIALFDVAT